MLAASPTGGQGTSSSSDNGAVCGGVTQTGLESPKPVDIPRCDPLCD
jgi:hypothetical protein